MLMVDRLRQLHRSTRRQAIKEFAAWLVATRSRRTPKQIGARVGKGVWIVEGYKEWTDKGCFALSQCDSQKFWIEIYEPQR